MSWTNMMLDLANIPTQESNPTGSEDETIIVSPEDEEMELRKSLRL